MRSKGSALIGYAFISPWLVGFVLLVLGPFVASIAISFCYYDIVSEPHWAGLENYRRLVADDPLFWKSLWVTISFAMVSVPLLSICGVALAMLLNLPLRGISIYRTIFFLPAIVPLVATCVVFMWLFNPQMGLINRVLSVVSIEGPAWLQEQPWAFWSLVILSLWGLGWGMIIYLAGLKDIPVALYEAAVIDGADTWQRIRHVTLPLLTPVIFFNLVMGVIATFQYFTQAYVMTQGGPEDSTMFYALYLYQRAWRYLDMGYASAMAWVLFSVVMLVTLAIFKTHHRWVHYE